MDNPSLALLSHQTGLQRRVDIVANNIANAGTTGFRREGLVFASRVERLDVPGRRFAMTEDRMSFTDPTAGGLTVTGNPLDMALDGDGLFAVQAGTGVAYTRDGRFMPDAEGRLVTATGHPVLDEGGAPIVLPPGAEALAVSADGTLSADGEAVAVIGRYRVDAGARRGADGLITTAGAAGPAPDTRVLGGHIENANVNPVRELTDLIEAQRAYERGQSMIEGEDERLRRAAERLAREP
ncbi:flagellar hook-basal body complex protein [Marinivivus vitaminiproducens]|uniref:flagellar hook-basal body complex protein n=1 Tax=Marinivivus vitaminiproducens TaxID=3035935 RepID=UPI00279EF474|nr:flagellar hook-basal body complex protein [Geminicoccaceae bacterium SCSIO 64248]